MHQCRYRSEKSLCINVQSLLRRRHNHNCNHNRNRSIVIRIEDHRRKEAAPSNRQHQLWTRHCTVPAVITGGQFCQKQQSSQQKMKHWNVNSAYRITLLRRKLYRPEIQDADEAVLLRMTESHDAPQGNGSHHIPHPKQHVEQYHRQEIGANHEHRYVLLLLPSRAEDDQYHESQPGEGSVRMLTTIMRKKTISTATISITAAMMMMMMHGRNPYFQPHPNNNNNHHLTYQHGNYVKH
mmetsp:Transcript_12064/g.34917  ORF Transcript_12064/g.34917 Transcript_12064/m.34917 type:complete len:238 (-) Transcript_12064:429-1142(-)